MRELHILKNDGGQRLDKFLQKALPGLPPSLMYKSIRTKKIKVNRKRCEPNQMLKEGDTLQLFLAESIFEGETKMEREELGRIRAELTPVYEDGHILVLHKPAGLSVHEDETGGGNNLIRLIWAYLYQKGEYDPQKEQSFAPALCHRIDRNTDGLVICAKTAEALRILTEKIRLHQIEKRYYAVVHGVPHPSHARLVAWHSKDEKAKKVTIYGKTPPPFAKKIETEYQVVDKREDLSLLDITLHTGRTHQIRAHMAFVGHPLLGDGKYGINKADREKGYTYQALCAYSLTFAFDDTPTSLDYLKGKTVTLPKSKIDFLSLFSK